jgi:hypothetical protein
MPGLVPGIHGTPTERQPLLNLRVFSQNSAIASSGLRRADGVSHFRAPPA